MKNKFLLSMVATGIMLTSTNVNALSGNATVEFTGNNNVMVGDTFTVKMNVKDVNNTYDGIVSLEGNLSFDKDMVEYVSAKSEDTPYEFRINENYNYKIAGLDFTLDNGILENVTVYEFTFKALKEGNTNITLNNYKLTDSKDYVNATVISSTITISEEKTTEEENTIVEEKTEVKEEINTKEVVEKETEEKVVIKPRKQIKNEKITNIIKFIQNILKNILK